MRTLWKRLKNRTNNQPAPNPHALAIHAIKLDRLARAISAEANQIKTHLSKLDRWGEPIEAEL